MGRNDKKVCGNLSLYLEAIEPRPAGTVAFQLWMYNYKQANQAIVKGRVIAQAISAIIIA